MAACTTDHQMLEGFPTLAKREIIHDGETYSRPFFGGLMSTTAPVSTKPAWDAAKTDYKIGDIIYIDELKTEYICGEAGSRLYPPSTATWQPRTANDYRQVDSIPTTKTTSTTDVVNIYNVEYMNYIVGHFIDGVATVTIEQLDNSMNPTGVIIATITMTEIIEFVCYDCCNPPPERKRYFSKSLMDMECATKFIKVTLKAQVGETIKIGTITPVNAINAGIPDFNTTVKVDDGIAFRRLSITEDIEAFNGGASIILTGQALIKPGDKKILHKRKMGYYGITFTIFDIPELEVIEGVVMGKFSMPNGLQLGLTRDTEYQFKKEGVLA